MPFTSVADEMHRFKAGKLHSGSHTGPVVHNRKQAVAIALSEEREAGGKESIKAAAARKRARKK